MHPALRKGQIVLARTAKVPRINDIVIFRHSGLEKIKRISQIEGNKIYLIGDNAIHSSDSRNFGWLDSSVIVAKVFYSRTCN
jgi:phage repressor protein C with HTH and peptisase S24 domain